MPWRGKDTPVHYRGAREAPLREKKKKETKKEKKKEKKTNKKQNKIKRKKVRGGGAISLQSPKVIFGIIDQISSAIIFVVDRVSIVVLNGQMCVKI